MKENEGTFTELLGRIVRFGRPKDADKSVKQVTPHVNEFQNEDGSIGRICYFDIRTLAKDEKVKIHARGSELFEILLDATTYDWAKAKEKTVARAELGSRVRVKGYLSDLPDYVHEDGKKEKQQQMNIRSDASFEVLVRKRKKAKPAPASAI